MANMKKLIVMRRLSQFLFLLLFVYILWSTTYPLKGALSPNTFFRFDPLIMIFISVSERVILAGIVLSLLMLALTFILGRFYCGWVCPLGTCIDYAGFFGKSANRAKNRPLKARYAKFFILGIIALLAAFGIQTAWFLDPMVIMARFVSLNLIPAATSLFNGIFVFSIKAFGLYAGPVYDLYNSLKTSVLGINVYFFAHSLVIFVFFVLVLAAALFISRAWCRFVCPLGAFYAIAAKFALLERRVTKGCTSCALCHKVCRMGAIKPDVSYIKGECVLCMDCVYICPEGVTEFTWKNKKRVNEQINSQQGGITRWQFLLFLMAAFFVMGSKFDGLFGRKEPKRGVIRPPGAIPEEHFKERCIRCGNCMKVCPTNALQPVFFKSGPDGIWTPELVPEIGWCEYNCNLCGQVCPTGAIKKLPLEKKQYEKMGLAEVSRTTCFAWGQKTDCMVCEEHCPIPSKAIKAEIEMIGTHALKKPVVDPNLCIGCGICQNKCPQRPERAIKVYSQSPD